MEYKQEVEYATKNNIVKLSDIFNFEETPYERLYDDLFKFCRENLDIHFEKKVFLKVYSCFRIIFT